MVNNILDKPAMESIHEIEKTVAVMAAKMEAVPFMSQEIKALSSDIVEMKSKLKALTKSIEDEPLKCPFRESASLLQEIVKDVLQQQDDLKQAQKDISANAIAIAEVRTEIKIAGGVNATLAAAFASIAGVLSNVLGK